MHSRMISGIWLRRADRASSALVSLFRSQGRFMSEIPSVKQRSYTTVLITNAADKCTSRRKVQPVPVLYGQTVFRRFSSVQDPRGGGVTIAAHSEDTETLGARILKYIGWLGGFYSKNAILLRSAKNLYECCVEGVAYEHFYEACRMPDTFQSWFLVNQMHVWMCLVRLKEEGKDGRFMYRKLVEIMWQDVAERMKVMGVHDTTTRRESLQELVENFYGLIFAYDEGLLSHDRVLAAALWRNMFHDKKNTDAIKLAEMVEYVRRQVRHLDTQDSKQLLTTGVVDWLPFKKREVEKISLHEAAIP